MSWWLIVSPLHYDDAYEWASAEGMHGVPATAPTPQPLPAVWEVLQAFREAGCHGECWFQIEGIEPDLELSACPNPASCAATGGLDLGEVVLHAADGTLDKEALRPATQIHGLGFRKPSPAAALRAVCALAPKAGPLIVVDDDCEGLVILPNDQPTKVAKNWPW